MNKTICPSTDGNCNPECSEKWKCKTTKGMWKFQSEKFNRSSEVLASIERKDNV